MCGAAEKHKRGSGSSQKYELYSCSRCRRLKKRCSKEFPACCSCQRAVEDCVYPGRAPRRTKKELEEARRRGDLVQTKKVRKKSECNTEHAGASQGCPTRSPGTEESVRNEIYAESAGNSHGSMFSSAVSNLSGDGTECSSMAAVSSFLNILSSISHTQHAPGEQGNLGRERKEFRQGKLEHETHRPESIPIKASSLQIEAIASVFKGARESPMICQEGTVRHIGRKLCDRFIAAYFKHNHRSYPLINKIKFLNQVAEISVFEALDDKYPDTFIFQLYMIMAIGCTTMQRAGFLDREQEGCSEHFSYMAMRNFCSVMHLQNVETIKCLLLLGIYSFFEPKGVSSWTISGLIMRLAIGMGLNKALTQKKIETMTALEIEMRHRAFWSFYAFERLVHTSLGRTSAIDDEDISVPLPRPLYEEERDDIEVTIMMLNLRRIAGQVFKKVHGVSAGRGQPTTTEKQNIINSLRKEINNIYEDGKEKIQRILERREDDSNISFHSSETWLAMRHAQLMIMLYRPSSLIPKPEMDSLTILGNSCLEALKHTYSLYRGKMLPLNWITLFRTLTVCNTILYCLCQWSIDLIESKIEIHQCVEILQHFGEKWEFARECADVFQAIGNTLLDISLSRSKVPDVEKLTRRLFGACNEYQDILDENSFEVTWTDYHMTL